jgi:signal transduction histidine kinase
MERFQPKGSPANGQWASLFLLFWTTIPKMKIRDKLLIGFSLYILLAVVCGFFAYRDLLTITNSLNLVEVADDLTNTILEVRRYEKNYLLYRDKNSLAEFRKYLSELKRNIDNMKAEMVRDIGTKKYGMMKEAIADFEVMFTRIKENLESQDQLIEQVRTSGRNVEQRLGGRSLQKFLVLRKYEKNLMIYKDGPTYEIFHKTYEALNMNGETESYSLLVKKLFELYQDEKNSVERLRLKAREIQSFTENLSKRERAKIGSVLRTSLWVLAAGLIAIILLGTLFNVKLANSIATPIRRLEKITKKIAMGDFTEAIEVTGKDEIASLEMSFNQMEDRLKDVMTSLESTIEILKEKQAQLVEAGKLAAIGKLAAGIAHEINNPLTSVLTFSSLMLEQTPEEDPRHERLRIIVRDTTRARNIVRQVLSFAREAPLKTVKMNVNRPVIEIIDSLVSQEAFKDIELTQDLSENLPDIDIDPVQIGQVVSNILINAIHAITPPGKIHVATEAASSWIKIIVSDTGKGIPQEHLKKVFDPFFTTKDKTSGTGLGLAVSYGIIKKHGGNIKVRSTLGEGTTFIVRLPLYEGKHLGEE